MSKESIEATDKKTSKRHGNKMLSTIS